MAGSPARPPGLSRLAVFARRAGMRALAAAILVLAHGCSDSRTSPESSLSLVLSTDSLIVRQGQTGVTEVTVRRPGSATGPVTIELVGLPEGASSPGTTLPGGESKGEVRVSAARHAPIGSAAARVRAGFRGATTEAPLRVRTDVWVDPVMLVHGFFTGGGMGTTAPWQAMMTRLADQGWRGDFVFPFLYWTSASNAETAELVSAAIDTLIARTGAEKVDLVTHSMGGLSTRHYLKHDDAPPVDAWVSLGGPNHGTRVPALETCAREHVSCAEMRIGSDFLAALNGGDETPGSVRYATWASPCDEVIVPSTSVQLEGAHNVSTPCLSHRELTTDPGVYAQVRAFIVGNR